MQFFKKKYPWHVEESIENMQYFDRELGRLHKLFHHLHSEDMHKTEVLERIIVMEEYILTIGKRIAGLKY